jgi:PhzF family phenazine biosynthesis protein
MFAPNIGIAEDPVTGNGHGPAGAYLVEHGVIGEGAGAFFIGRQGEAIGRPGDVEVTVDGEAGDVSSVRVGGHAAIVFDTTLNLRD